jgi:hypothetical protein
MRPALDFKNVPAREREREYHRRYRAEHLEKHRESNRKYREAHRQEIRARSRKYYETTREERRRCRLEGTRKWKAANPEKVQKLNYKHGLKRAGFAVQEYNSLLTAQGGGCAICGGLPGRRKLAVDHDHATGKIRGLLCGSCNTMLGHTHDDQSILKLAIEYLSERG